MIVSEPFAVAYGLNALLHTMIIDIGAGTTDFCVMKGRYPTDDDQRSLTAAGDSIDTQLMKLIQTRYPTASFTVFMVREWKEKYSFVGKPPKPVHRHGAGERRADAHRHHGRDADRLRIDRRADRRNHARSAAARRTGIPGARSQERHSGGWRRADSRSRSDPRAGTGKSRWRQGQGHRRAGVRRLRWRPGAGQGCSGQRLGSAAELSGQQQARPIPCVDC